MTTEPEEPTTQEALSASRADRDRTLRAVHRLESALAMAADSPGWLDEVTADLESLESALVDERSESDRPDSLLSLIAGENPRRFGSRVHHLHHQMDETLRRIVSLRRQLEHPRPTPLTATELRHEIGALTQTIHSQRARQSDLVYDALALNLGER